MVITCDVSSSAYVTKTEGVSSHKIKITCIFETAHFLHEEGLWASISSCVQRLKVSLTRHRSTMLVITVPGKGEVDVMRRKGGWYDVSCRK